MSRRVKMRQSRVCALVCVCGLSCASVGLADGAIESAITSVAVATGDPATLQAELDALNHMTEVMGPMVRDAKARLKLMNEFVSNNGMSDDAARFEPDPAARGPKALTFNEALKTARDHQDLAGSSAPSSQDVDTLQTEVAATQTLVHSQWNNLNKLHTQVATLSGFLASKDKLDAYQDWAVAKNTQEASDKSAAIAEKASDARKQHQNAEHQANMRYLWDEQQFRENAYANDVGHYNSEGGWVAGTGHGPVDGGDESSDSDGEYNDGEIGYSDGSYWNGYADPYYDVWGYPGGRGRLAARAGARVGARYGANRPAERHNNRWHRNAGPRPHVSPSMHHMSRGRR